MLIKHLNLEQDLKNKIAKLYFLSGQEPFLQFYYAQKIKKTLKKLDPEMDYFHFSCDEKNDCWQKLIEESHYYSLLSQRKLFEISGEKKAIEHAGQECILQWLQNLSQDNVLLIRMPNIGAKSLNWLIHETDVNVVQITPLQDFEYNKWIIRAFAQKSIHCPSLGLDLIKQYCQGNLGAINQLIEKCSLLLEPNAALDLDLLKEQLMEQANYQLFELCDACLAGDSAKVIAILRQANQTKVEPPLVLWFLAELIRQLIQLHALTAQPSLFNAKCKKLKIWQYRIKLYQKALNKLTLNALHYLLKTCQRTDELIKSNNNDQAWHALEQISLYLSSGKKIGYFA